MKLIYYLIMIKFLNSSPKKKKSIITHKEVFKIIQLKDESIINLEKRSPFSFPALTHFDQVFKSHQFINKERCKQFMIKFTQFYNRFYNSENAYKSQKYLLNYIQKLNQTYNLNNHFKLKINEFKHIENIPNSIIIKIEGSDQNLKDEIIILGSHIDSINNKHQDDDEKYMGYDEEKEAEVYYKNLANHKAPGADDDASGVVTILEIFTVLLQSNLKLKRSIEFHFYSGEELYLIGSEEIALKYKQDKIKVIAMLQLDLTGYLDHLNKMAIFIKDTDSQLNTYLSELINKYSLYKPRFIDLKDSFPGANSDSAAWTHNGYKASFPIENTLIPYIHTEKDTIDKISFESIEEFVKVGLGFVIELSDPPIKN